MKIAGIVAEYNPFHNGHAYHIEQTRKAGFSHIAVCMSGAFVQRGEPAVLDKWTRARMAIEAGADLVVELPAVYALSAAPDFARGAVTILHELGAKTLSFGSECGDADILCSEASRLAFLDESEGMQAFLSAGMSYPRARQAAYEALYGDTPAFASPNDLLGVEYIRAAKSLDPDFSFLAVTRQGSAHDSDETDGSFASASNIRSLLAEPFRAAPFMPNQAFLRLCSAILHDEAPARLAHIERHILFVLRNMTAADFARLPDVGEGLENRLVRAAQEASSLNEFYELVKTKRYTHARIRRIVCCAALGISAQDRKANPAYIRVLALNRRGAEILSACKKKTELSVGANFADLARLDPPGLCFDIRAQELFSLAQPKPSPKGADYTKQVKLTETE